MVDKGMINNKQQIQLGLGLHPHEFGEQNGPRQWIWSEWVCLGGR